MNWTSKGRWRLVALAGVLVVALASCALVVADPTPIPSPTSAPRETPQRPTETPVPPPSPTVAPKVKAVLSPSATPTPAPTSTPVPTPTLTPVPPTATAKPAPDSLISVLLLGYRGAGMTGGAYLTDTMMLAVYNPAKQWVILLSIPRDIYIGYTTQGMSSSAERHKINEAFAFGGGALSKKVVSQLLGHQIESYFAVDFNNFQKAINQVGGIDVNVPQSFGNFKAGRQHFDGERALEYVRVRSVASATESSDFARSRRQRQVIEAFLAKLRTPAGILHLVPLAKIATSAVRTDLKLPSIGDMTTLVRTSGDLHFYEVGISSHNYLHQTTSDSGLWILEPSSRAGTWDQIRGMTKALVANPTVGESMVSHRVTVVNATGGVANKALWDYVESLGCRVGTVQTAQARDTTSIVAAKDDKDLSEWLRAAFEEKGTSAQVELSGSGSPVITFGRDWKGG